MLCWFCSECSFLSDIPCRGLMNCELDVGFYDGNDSLGLGRSMSSVLESTLGWFLQVFYIAKDLLQLFHLDHRAGISDEELPGISSHLGDGVGGERPDSSFTSGGY